MRAATLVGSKLMSTLLRSFVVASNFTIHLFDDVWLLWAPSPRSAATLSARVDPKQHKIEEVDRRTMRKIRFPSHLTRVLLERLVPSLRLFSVI